MNQTLSDHKISQTGNTRQSLASELATKSITDYSISTDLSSELRVATLAYYSIQQEFNRIGKTIKAGGIPRIDRITPLLEALVESIIRNPAAGVWLARLKSKSSYGHRHCISCSILCVVMGRQLGLGRDEMFHLGLAGLLMDVGKLLLPDGLLRKTGGLTDKEHQETQTHIELGLSAIKESQLPAEVINTIQYHHERFDGTGYPAGLVGKGIPLYARIAAVVDCYDAIGLYPPGSLVELTTGEVAVVSDFRSGMGRKPELTVILDANKKRLSRKKVLVLSGQEGNVDIAKNLPPDAYDLDPEALF